VAPEQARGKDVDRRADVFAIGVMAFEAVTRRRMWKGVREQAILTAILAGNIPTPKEFDPDVDDELDRIIRKATAFEADERYATAADFHADLAAYVHSKGPRPGPRELGAFVANLFADKRKATSKIIEHQLGKLRRESVISVAQLRQNDPPSSTDTGALGAEYADTELVPFSGSSVTPSSRTLVAPAPAEDDDGGATRLLSEEPPNRRKLLLGVVVALLVLVVAAIVGVIAMHPTAASRPPTTIKVVLRATPLETHFNIDSGPPLENPYIGEFPRDGKPHAIRAVAAGYNPKEEKVVFDDDVSMRFTLGTAAK
jgi:serine/threonine-protein kinase